MHPKYQQQLTTLLRKLKNSTGHFAIQSGSFDVGKHRGDEVYCQLIKDWETDPIRMEALSHHFDPRVDKTLVTQFKSLGFTLLPEENYAKEIFLFSEKEVKETVSEIIHIFEAIYKIAKNTDYDFDDQIDFPKKSIASKPFALYNFSQLAKTQGEQSKLHVPLWVKIIILSIIIYFLLIHS